MVKAFLRKWLGLETPAIPPPIGPSPDMVEMLKAVQKMSDATIAQANALNEYFALFKVATPPVSRTMRDQDEWEMELNRRGFPINGTPEEQGAWVLSQTE